LPSVKHMTLGKLCTLCPVSLGKLLESSSIYLSIVVALFLDFGLGRVQTSSAYTDFCVVLSLSPTKF